MRAAPVRSGACGERIHNNDHKSPNPRHLRNARTCCHGDLGGDSPDQTQRTPVGCGKIRIQTTFKGNLGWLMGLEPTTTGITIRDSTT